MARSKLGPFDLGSIDGGNKNQSRICYVAYWRGGGLYALAQINHSEYAKGALGGYPCTHVVCETPIIYHQDNAKANDIVGVNIAVCLLAGAMSGGSVTTYTQKEWKGNQAKPPHHLEIFETLTPREQLIVGGQEVLDYINRGIDLNAPRYYKKPLRQYAAEATNYLDAIGIGLVFLGRMKKP